MLTNLEIRVLFHVLDCIGPDLERRTHNVYELKSEDSRKIVNNISFTTEEYKAFMELKDKLKREIFNTNHYKE